MVFSGPAVGSFGKLGGSLEFEWVPRPVSGGTPTNIAQDILVVMNYYERLERPLLYAKERIRRDVIERFDTKTDPRGISWKRWSALYEDDAVLTNVNGLLERRGNMRRAVTNPLSYRLSDNTVWIDTSDWFTESDHSGLEPLWIYHQTGAIRREGGGAELTDPETGRVLEGGMNVMPARPLLGPSALAQEDIAEVFALWFQGGINIFNRQGRVQMMAVETEGSRKGMFTSGGDFGHLFGRGDL